MDDVPCIRPDTARPLDPGTRLLHIGPHKTGTTALQGALFAARERLAEHAIDYPGEDRHPMYAALAASSRPSMMGDRQPRREHWDRLVEAVAASGDRTVVVSSEFFAEADASAISRVVADLDGPRVHVVVTLRPLAKILPSQWQQYVQNGLRMGYRDWLEHMLRKPPYEQPNPSFWLRHAHDRLVERWSGAVGVDRLTVVVVDDRDRDMLLRAFESLLALPVKTLEHVTDAANRSLTLGEVEMIRHFNIEFRSSGLPERMYSRNVRYGAIMRMKTAWSPPPDHPRVTTPGWALERAAQIGSGVADRIRELGVRVHGDLRLLHEGPTLAPETGQPIVSVDPAAAAQALFGAIASTHEPPATPPRTQSVHQTRSTELMRVLLRRLARRAGRVLHIR
ncbi:hypothetical protein [Streptomyces sp. TS71-3]|uniref:hypothetical protein n=1 Tax=Streptomyces sp. TS71-3 TaxID=2733862 RepID=UPI001B1131DC|nr:hypothetical protein [Streptomyces sp. TS71-3]GHJ41304.1 hypothetical protein Sm713_69130 [Streptomyces sp. TS71-3]